MKEMSSYRLGLDVGRVLKDHGYVGGEVPGALPYLKLLIKQNIFEEIYLVSQCLWVSRYSVRRWLIIHEIQTILIDPSHIIFCNRDSWKANIAKEHRFTHFVDDHLTVLTPMTSVPHRYLFGGARPPVLPDGITHVNDWEHLFLYFKLLRNPPQ